MASAVCMDKVVFKELMARPASRRSTTRRCARATTRRRSSGSACRCSSSPRGWARRWGISKVSEAAELPGALEAAFGHDPNVIVEAMAHGLEVECSVLGNREPEASQPGQIVIEADWYDYEAKYEPGGMELRVPPDVPEPARERVRELAVEVFLRVGCAGMARVDFFVEDPDGEPRVLVNELNTIPGFTADERVREAVRGQRRALRAAARPAPGAGAGAPPARARLRLLRVSYFHSRRSTMRALLPSGSETIQTR